MPVVWVPVVLLAAAAACVAVDTRVVAALGQEGLPGDLVRLVHLSEVFAHGMGVAGILACLYVVDRARRARLVRAAVATGIAGLGGILLKLPLLRLRPEEFFQRFGRDAPGWWSFQPWGAVPWDQWWDRQWHSFPSGHAATAAGLAVALSWVYPQGRVVFTVLAVLACLQRVVAHAHFPSDVLAGAAVGILLSRWFLGLIPRPGRLMHRAGQAGGGRAPEVGG